MLLIIVVMCVALWAKDAAAQNVVFFGSKEGLSNSRVSTLCEDSRHNIWITTQNGLNRYDGVKMNTYRHEVGNTESLLHNECTCVMELEDGKLLVGTEQGLQLYDYATDRFTLVPFLSLEGDTTTLRVVNICRIEKDRVVVCVAGYGHGELRLRDDGAMWVEQSAEFNTGEEQGNPVQFVEDRRGRLWIVNSRHNLYVRTQGGFRQCDEVEGVRKLSVSSSGRLYAATMRRGIYAYDEKAGRFVQVASAEDVGGEVYGFNPWTDGRMFICTDGTGLKLFDERTGKVTPSTIRANDFNLATSNVKDAIGDAFGNVWVGIYWKGVLMKPVNQSAFEYVGQYSIAKNTIGNNAIFDIARAPGGRLWVAADNDGLYLLSADGTASTHWSKDTGDSSMPQAFTALLNVDERTLLLGSYSDGLWQMRDGRFSLLTKEVNRIFDIAPAAERDCYWIATMGGGFFYYDHHTGLCSADLSEGTEQTGRLANSYIYTLLPLSGRLYVGTADGLSVCEVGQGGRITKASQKVLERTAVRHIAASADGRTLWIGTDAGLVKMDTGTLSTRIYTTADGLPINHVSSLCIDGAQLWIGTDFGLSCMDMKAETFTNFFVDDGLQDNEFCRGASLAMDGKLYFGGIGGLTYFDAKTMRRWQSEQKMLQLRLIDLYVGNRTMHKGDMSGRYEVMQNVIDLCERIELCHTDNHFTLELGVAGLTNQHIDYEYSIDGGEWNTQGGNSGRLVFDNLQPGTYHIRMRARAGNAVSDERLLVAVINPAWYASPWAKVVYFVLALLAIWLIVTYTRRQLQARKLMERHKQQEEINEVRIQFFMNISHEIRTPMTLILAPLEKLIGSDRNPDRQRNYKLMKQNAKRILRLINQMMDVRKIEQGKFLLDYRQVEIVGFLQNIFDVFVTNAQGRGITYEYMHDMEAMHAYVDPDNTDKIVMNLLSNAFKFTPDGGHITLRLTTGGTAAAADGKGKAEGNVAADGKADAYFTISVTDSGMGISDEDKPKVFDRFYSATHQNGYIGTGIGLNLTSMLAKLHNGSVDVADNPEGQGTQFTVTLPVGDSSLLRMKTEALASASSSAASAPAAASQTLSADGTQEMEGMDSIEEDTEELLTIAKPADTHRRNALLVEDDEAIRQYVHSELSTDLLIHSCTNGQEAWDYIVSHPGKVDIIVSDIMMPVMDGMTLCQKVKQNFNTNHIPIVLMTALGSDSDRIAGITNGADAYVSKPFNIDVLRTTVMQLLKSRQLLQGKFHGDRHHEEHIDKVEIESPDEHLMKRVMKVINENMDNPELSVEIIADQVGISRVHFYRKMKDLTGQAPRDFLKYVRLKEAARLLAEKKLDITGVSIATGFKSLSSFSTNFKSLYGLSPSEWVKQNHTVDEG